MYFLLGLCFLLYLARKYIRIDLGGNILFIVGVLIKLIG